MARRSTSWLTVASSGPSAARMSRRTGSARAARASLEVGDSAMPHHIPILEYVNQADAPAHAAHRDPLGNAHTPHRRAAQTETRPTRNARAAGTPLRAHRRRVTTGRCEMSRLVAVYGDDTQLERAQNALQDAGLADRMRVIGGR